MKQAISIEEITPAVAAKYLENNDNNRPVSNATVRKYAEAMKRGEWMLNGTTIGFDRNNKLVDGQHRLMAVILSGVTIQAIVVRDLAPEVFTTIDCGRARTAGQILAINNVPNFNIVGCGIKKQSYLNRGLLATNRSKELSNVEVLDIFNTDREHFIEAGRFAVRICQTRGKMALSSGEVCGIYYHLIYNLGNDKEVVETFLDQVFSYNTALNPMVDALRVKFIKDLSATTKMTLEYKQNLLAKVWNKYKRGRIMKCIKWDKDVEGTILYR